MGGLSDEDVKFIEQNLPPPYNNAERFHEAFNHRLIEHKDLCVLIIKEVDNAIKPLEDRMAKKRFFCRIDSSHQTKSPSRIIQKMHTEKNENGFPKHTWDDFTITMKDLARFRIVVNFLGDIERVVEAIEKHEIFNNLFEIKKTNTIHNPLKGRLSGERSVKLVLTEKESSLSVEIQVMTMFQETWDKKDHPLVYEFIRIGKDVPHELKALSLITSELLYTADNYFEDFRKDEERF